MAVTYRGKEFYNIGPWSPCQRKFWFVAVVENPELVLLLFDLKLYDRRLSDEKTFFFASDNLQSGKERQLAAQKNAFSEGGLNTVDLLVPKSLV
jgi:hypothetical protein